MRDLRQRAPQTFSDRVRELAYLVNVWMAGGVHQGRRPRPVEALETALRTCEAGLRRMLPAGAVQPGAALDALCATPADQLFRSGFRDG
jgi:hypothetical protein